MKVFDRKFARETLEMTMPEISHVCEEERLIRNHGPNPVCAECYAAGDSVGEQARDPRQPLLHPGEAGVRITAILAPEGKKRGKVSLMVEDLVGAEEALKAAKIRFSEEEVLEFDVDNRPGAFGEVAGKLARSKININFVYVTTSPFGRAEVIMGVHGVEKALRALGE